MARPPEESSSAATTTTRGHVRLGAGIPNLASLGADRVEDLLGEDGGRLIEEDRAERRESDEISTLWRIPFPGTPDATGNFTRPPRGAGTGWMIVRRYERSTLGQTARARFTKPRSDSLASREWNLLCAMRAAGLSTLEPLAVAVSGRAGAAGGFIRRSALVVRAPERLLPLIQVDLDDRETGAVTRQAVLEEIEALTRAGFYLPRLDARNILISYRHSGADACGEDEPPIPGLELNPRPSVVFAEVRGGRMYGKLPERKAKVQRAALAATLRAS